MESLSIQDYQDRKSQINKKNSRLVPLINILQIGVSNAYINGLELPDILVLNSLKSLIYHLYTRFSSLLIPYPWILEESTTLAEDSHELMKIQYNLPTDLFRLMIGESQIIYPKYSMGLWKNDTSSLEEAQTKMLDDLIQKLEIRDGDNILDIGCGWGSAANYILKQFDHARLTGLNLSSTQCEYIQQKMQDSKNSLSDGRFTLCQGDFNEVNFTEKFDKIIAIGFFEHIGNLTNSFRKIASFLKPDGKVFIHIIVTRLPHNISSPFINTYIFPKSRIWNYYAVSSCNDALKTIQQWYLNGLNYAHTLRCWLKNFDNHQAEIQALDFGMNYQKFRRMWRLYLLWCISYFETCDGQILGNGQYLMEHK